MSASASLLKNDQISRFIGLRLLVSPVVSYKTTNRYPFVLDCLQPHHLDHRVQARPVL